MDKNLNPKISVLMPVYNCRPFIEESVNSILNQTFEDFEFIIIDDCSTDGTYEYLQTLTDPRIIIIRKVKNSGYTISLNMGLKMAKGMYIARMDGDDISFPDRFEKQVTFMDENPDIILSGGGYKAIDSDFKFIPRTSSEDIVLELMSLSPIAHPTAFFRSDILNSNSLQYNTQYEPAEDYKMWTTLVEYGKLANITDIILHYRIHPNQTTNLRAKIQREKTNLIALEYIKKLSKDHENSEYFCNEIIHSVEDLNKYEGVEKTIKLTLQEKGVTINNNYLMERKKEFITPNFIQDRYSIPSAIKDLKLLLKCRTLLGNYFIFKYLIKSIFYYKATFS